MPGLPLFHVTVMWFAFWEVLYAMLYSTGSHNLIVETDGHPGSILSLIMNSWSGTNEIRLCLCLPVLVSPCEGDVEMNWCSEVHLQGQRNKYEALTSGLYVSACWLCYWKSDCFILKSCLQDKLLFQIKLSRSLSHLFVSKEGRMKFRVTVINPQRT